jgi:hypothetical protein
MKQWIAIVEKELMGTQKLSVNMFNNLMVHNSCFFYLGYTKDKPVVTSLLYVNEHVAGIY